MSDKPFNLLIVCRGNVNRSPALEALFAREARKYLDLKVSSAGLNPSDYPRGMSDEMYDILVGRGFYYEARKIWERPGPTILQPEMIEQNDLILCSDPDHVLRIRQSFVEEAFKGKIHTLPEYAGFAGETIPDPSKKLKNISYAARLGIWAVNKFDPEKAHQLKIKKTSNFKRVNRIYQENVDQMMRYIPGALERLEREDKIHRF
ncbi:MAG: hypothetical protein Q8Q31_00335 [Nanoarchaeota archaeon]|nr:hypothetical protein [Nanoarchaeota archaeon]